VPAQVVAHDRGHLEAAEGVEPREVTQVGAAAGGGVAGDQLAWFEALGRYKMAAIMGHNLRRHLEGRHHDPDQERLPETIRRLIETGHSIAP